MMIQLALMVMRKLDIGYFVRTDAIRIDDDVLITDDKSDDGFALKNGETFEDIPIMTIDTKSICDEFRLGLEDLMSNSVFSSADDWDNYCMAVFYSLTGIRCAPHYFTMFDEGGSGKSTLLDGLDKFAGELSTKELQLDNLMRTGFEHGMAASRLEGKRLAIQDEIKKPISPEAMSTLNGISSGMVTEARYGGGAFKYIPLRLAIWFSGNSKVDLPQIDAVLRRYVNISLRNEMDNDD